MDVNGNIVASRRVRFWTARAGSAPSGAEFTALFSDAALTIPVTQVLSDSQGLWGPVFTADTVTQLVAGAETLVGGVATAPTIVTEVVPRSVLTSAAANTYTSRRRALSNARPRLLSPLDVIPAVTSTPPTILFNFRGGIHSAPDGTAPANQRTNTLTAPALGSDNASVARVYGGMSASVVAPGGVSVDSSNTWQPPSVVTFETDAPVWELQYVPGPGQTLMFLVDGKYTSPSWLTFNTSGYDNTIRRLTVCHGTPTTLGGAAGGTIAAGTASITLPIAPSVGDTLALSPATYPQEVVRVVGAITGTGPYTVPVTALTMAHPVGDQVVICSRQVRRIQAVGAPVQAILTDTASTVKPYPGSGIRAGFLGDSYLQSGFFGFAPLVCRFLGWDSFGLDGLGGTGYAGVGATNTPFTHDSRIGRMMRAQFDVNVFVGGINDQASTLAQIRAAADAVFAQTVAQCKPGAVNLVVGPFAPTTPSVTAHQDVGTALSAAAAAVGFPYVDTLADPAFFGVNDMRAPATPYSGNSDIYIKDGTHPTVFGDPTPAGVRTGQEFLGLYLAEKIAIALAA